MLAFLLVPGCDDGPPPNAEPKKAEAKKPVAAPKAPTKKVAAAKAEEEGLTERDFMDREGNRDPFHSFVLKVAEGTRRPGRRQRKVMLKRYALDELKLIAVITGQARPRAMFRDPKGLGVLVKRGDYISKSEGRVKQILSDKVVVEIEQSAESKHSKSDRVIPLHLKGRQSLLQNE